MRTGSPILIIGISIISLFSVGAILLLLAPSIFPLYNLDNRISLAALFISVASLAALLLAVWEFAQAQRRPKLRLWIEPYIDTGLYGDLTQTHSHWGRQAFEFMFILFLENYGDAPARFVKITIDLHIDPLLADLDTRFFRRGGGLDPPSGRWTPSIYDETGERCYSHWHTFHGGDDFVSYNHPKKVDRLEPWLDDLGFFTLDISGWDQFDFVPNQELPVKLVCSLYADGYAEHEQVLKFLVPAETEDTD